MREKRGKKFRDVFERDMWREALMMSMSHGRSAVQAVHEADQALRAYRTPLKSE